MIYICYVYHYLLRFTIALEIGRYYKIIVLKRKHSTVSLIWDITRAKYFDFGTLRNRSGGSRSVQISITKLSVKVNNSDGLVTLQLYIVRNEKVIDRMEFNSGAKKEVGQLPEAVQVRIKTTVKYAKIWWVN